MEFALWVLAGILVVAGIVALICRKASLGIVLIVSGPVVGFGGVSLLRGSSVLRPLAP